MINCHDINRHMNGDQCPTAGSLGECAAITQNHAEGSLSPYFTARLYLWKAAEGLKSETVAKWFYDLGATYVTVSAVLFDSDNGIHDGRHDMDGVRPWDVSYLLPNTETERVIECDFEIRKHTDGSSDYRCGCASNMTLLQFFRCEVDSIKLQRDGLLAALERFAKYPGCTCEADYVIANAAIASVKGDHSVESNEMVEGGAA